MKEYPIVFSTDNNYIPYLSAAIRSLIENANKKDEYKIFVLYEKLDSENISIIKTMARENITIDFIEITKCLEQFREKFYTKMHISIATYYRFLIPELFKNYEKVLYLDCDLIVNCDVKELFEIDIQDNILVSSVDIVTTDKRNKYYSALLNLDIEPKDYFNAGVYIIDIKNARNFNLLDKCFKALSVYKNLSFMDQTILNIVLKGKYFKVDQKYNLQWQLLFSEYEIMEFIDKYLFEEYKKAIYEPKIIHYTSSTKPWNSIKRKQYLAHYFWKYARLTPFYEIILFKMFASVEEEYKKITKLELLNCKIKSKIPWKKQDYYRKKYMNLKEKIRIYEELRK